MQKGKWEGKGWKYVVHVGEGEGRNGRKIVFWGGKFFVTEGEGWQICSRREIFEDEQYFALEKEN